MGCPNDQTLLAVLERTLEVPAARELETHVEGCAACREVLHSLATAKTALGTPPPGAPSGSEPEAAAPVDAPVSLGERYEVKQLLGRGGMGAVYLARDLTLGREVAVKLHGAGSGGDRLHREAIAMAKLAHPNVVTVFEVASYADRLYVAMEYVRGGTLRTWLAAEPRGWREKLAMLIDAGEGLAAAHAAELIHRDFKPENVLVGDDGRARVSDFGIAHVGLRASDPILPLVPDSDVATPMTVTGAVMGTPAYMAPEQLAGDPIDARADQFAFCVVVWEALFGARPFAGTSLATIAVAIERQELARPARSDVPQRIVDLVARGLRPSPEQRHADLPALLAQLRAASARKRGRWITLGALAVAVPAAVVVTALTTGGNSAAADACAVDPQALAGAWDPAIKAKLTAAYTAARPGDGAQIATRVGGALDGYAERWIASRRRACEATRVRGEQSAAVQGLREACLDHKRDELAALTGQLVGADSKMVMTSTRAVLAMTSLSKCDDVAALTSPQVAGQVVRARVEAQFSELAAARAFRLLGKYDLAITKAEAVAKAAQELKYRPLEAEALLVVGDLKDRTGDSATAVKVLEQAAVAANAGNDHQTAAEAWSTLAWVLGTGERNFDRAMWAVQMGRAAFEALGGSPELEAQLTNYEGLIYEAKGKLPEARAKLVAARDAYEKLGFTDTWQMSIVLNDLGGIERKLGHLDVAQEMHERALAIRTKLFGDAHPFVFSSLNNLGTVAWSRGDYAGAEAWFDKALACAIKVFPPQHPQTALVLSNLASVYDNEDKLDQSVATYRRALAMYEAMRGPDHPDVADTLRGLANVLREQDKGAEAAQAFERALTIMSAKQDDPTRVKLLADYGELLIATDPKRAETMLREAQTIVEEASSKTDPELGYSLTALGDLYTRTKRPALARGVLERALAIRTADGDTDPEDLAHTELALAQALWTTPKDRPRALALARGAQQRLEAAKATKRPGYRRVTAWLASHR